MTSLEITYGNRGGPRSGHIREGRLGVANPSFTVAAGKTPPLRFNTDLGQRFPPDFLSTVPTNEQKLAYLRHEIAGALDLFANYQRTFLDRYFDFIVKRCAEAAADLDSDLAWSGELLQADDYAFSALWPLPDCTLTLSTDGDRQAAGNCDFAFWSGQHVIAVTLTASPNRQDENNATTTPGLILPVTILAADLNADAELFSEPRFPPEFVTFWAGDRVPSSPFRPDGLPVSAQGAP
jgi:hypothetical protein